MWFWRLRGLWWCVGIGTGESVYFVLLVFWVLRGGRGVRGGELGLKQAPPVKWDVAVIRIGFMDEAAVSCFLGSCMPK